MDDKAKDAAALPVTLAMDGKNLLPVLKGDTTPRIPAPFPAVLLVCLWSLVSAGLFTTFGAIFFKTDQTDCLTPIVNKSLWWSKCYELTGSNDLAARALLHGLTRGCVPQAALALLALLLAPRRRIARRALALATLAVNVTNHCILAWLAGLLFVGTSGDALGILLLVAIVGAYVFPAAVFALFFFVALVPGGDLVE
ncbi:hypothetical protein C2845_PM10G11530 [Panicum miliaceum]|uniref:Uncharacterized protein n=1 Tax=Panicum miliaceum TaxID=4540 RepID=A0A3L6PFW8_PANMI|nr:hypothetical protein C2845_PM10G11530 [Panicum miliaceum]